MEIFRPAFGVESHYAVMTPEQAKYVKDLPRGYGSILKLASQWNVRPSTLYSIRAGRNWRHV